MSERVRLAVEIAMDAIRHLEPAELDEAITEIERRMIALAEGRVSSPFKQSVSAGVELVAAHIEDNWGKYIDEETVHLVARLRALKGNQS